MLLAVGTVALAWGCRRGRPCGGCRWSPPVGLALLVSPLALAMVAVPVVAELLQGRYQEVWKDMAALGLAIGVWLLLPVWVAGQDLGAGQAGWLLGRPSGRGPAGASVAAAPAHLAADRRRPGRRHPDLAPPVRRQVGWRPGGGPAARLGRHLGRRGPRAIALGYSAEQALPFAVPAAAVSLAVGAVTLAAAGRTPQARQVAAGVPGTAGVAPGGSEPGLGSCWWGCSPLRRSTGPARTGSRPTTACGAWWRRSAPRYRRARRSTLMGPTTGPGCWPPASP